MSTTDVDIESDARVAHERVNRKLNVAGGLTALGIVYGDIGTSPLYAMQTIIKATGPVDRMAALGILSLIVWTLLITISLKYCILVMRADNAGEGGILALMSLLGLTPTNRRWLLVGLGLFGAALLYGDGVITPAISVISAIEGVNVATSAFKPYVLPVAAGILIALFVAQAWGTARIAKVFGPVMLVWFLTIGAIGAVAVVRHPDVLVALDPFYGLAFLAGHGLASLGVLGGVFLTVTGGEALYADMGHVGRTPIRICWFALVLPALVLSYAGMTGLLIDGAGKSDGGNPFFLLIPSWAVVPLVVLATAATIIASQAIITGAFSMTRQGMQLGWFPGMSIRQTSDQEYGQIYVPVVNWMMMAATLAIAIGFGSSDALAGAYGTAVSTTMLATTVLLFRAMVDRWHWPMAAVIPVAALLLVVDVGFFSANIMKIGEGGWVPLLLGLMVYLLATTWRDGIEAIGARLADMTESPRAFVARIAAAKVPRTIGTAVFLTRAGRPVPALMIRHVEQFGTLPESAVSLTVMFTETPRLVSGPRVTVEQKAERLWHITAHYGFVEIPNLTAALHAARGQGCDLDLSKAVFFGARDSVVRSREHPLLPRWRLILFSILYRNSEHLADRFELPVDRFVEIGRRIAL